MPIRNNINFLVSDIKACCKRNNIDITQKIAIALMVEWLVTGCEPDDLQDVFTENGIIDPPNVWDSTIDVLEYFERLNLTVLIKHINYTNSGVSYVKFDMGGEQAYLDFYMTPYRSDFVNGSYGIRLIANTGGWVKG